jgi:metallophosphoesterase (TIGR03767 family)
MRRFVSIGLLVALGGLLTLPGSGSATGDGGGTGTTLDQTIVAEGERDLGVGPGRERVTRTLDWDVTKGTGKAVAGFKQVSDIHVLDEESPARVEYFDVCTAVDDDLSSAYRPHEAMTLQVGDSMIRQLNAIDEGPATGTPLDFMISTGDNVDNNQLNEMKWFVDLLDGETIDPNSGGATYDGYTQENVSWALDDETLSLAQESFDAAGADVPWYGVIGNHDGLVQGTILKTAQFNVIAQGGIKAFPDMDTYDNCPTQDDDFEHLLDAFTDAYLNEGEQVPSDGDRDLLDRDTLIAEFFGDNTTSEPNGHGFGNAPDDPFIEKNQPAGYYSFKISNKVRGIVMDTVAYSLGATGQIPDAQFRWIEKQLKKNSKVYYNADGQRRRNPDAKNKLLVLFSHHHSTALANTQTPEEAPEGTLPLHCFDSDQSEGCADGEGLHSLLNRYPNVVAWVNGHGHRNRVLPFPGPEGTDAARGFWEINTAAHIDWPQQSRLIEIAWKPGKNGKPDTVFIYGTTVDHGAAVDPDQSAQSTVDYLASLSRVESYYDACVRPLQAECEAPGTADDQNVKLVQKAPFDLGN